GMIEPDFGAFLAGVDPCDARDGRHEFADLLDVPSNMDVRDLVIADGKGVALERIEKVAERPGTHRQQAGLPEGTIDEDLSLDIDKAVFAHDPDPRADLSGGIQNRLAGLIELTD